MAYSDNPHKVGRPFRGSDSKPAANVTTRLTGDEQEALDAHVERTGHSRSALIREAMRAFGLFGKRAVRVEGDA